MPHDLRGRNFRHPQVVPVTSADQPTLFAPDPEGSLVKPQGALPVQMRVLITVKAAPNPSETYGETVCVAGIRVDEGRSGWVRLYPINFRELESERTFRKYDIVSLNARPASADPRAESFRPLIDTIRHERMVKGWEKRRPFVIDHVHGSMCELLAAVRDRPPFRSLAAIRPRVVQDLEIKLHPGWTPPEQAKIDRSGDLFEAVALRDPGVDGGMPIAGADCDSILPGLRCPGRDRGGRRKQQTGLVAGAGIEA